MWFCFRDGEVRYLKYGVCEVGVEGVDVWVRYVIGVLVFKKFLEFPPVCPVVSPVGFMVVCGIDFGGCLEGDEGRKVVTAP